MDLDSEVASTSVKVSEEVSLAMRSGGGVKDGVVYSLGGKRKAKSEHD